jgi:predicted KAP-like P-loop ATPase
MSGSGLSAGPATDSLISFVSADRPIERRQEDRLKRGPFVSQLARVLREWRHRDSLVIALFGPWGSGKTSLVNLVLEHLGEHDQKPEVVSFNPWQWSGHEQLTAAFFKEIQTKLGHADASEDAKHAAKLMKSYGAFLATGKEVLSGIPEVAQATLALIAFAGVSPVFYPPLAQYWSVIGAVAVAGTLLTVLLSKSQLVLEAYAKWKEARSELDKRTLAELKAELSSELRKLDRQFLIVIDDIDRLSPQEMREIFQLVKANADFPNFVYLLAFQRSSVAALKDIPDNGGDAFLEKIIQIGFDVPPVDRSAIDAILMERLNAIFRVEMEKHRFDQERWLNVYHDGLREYFSDLRDVNRFAASLAFYTTLFRANGLIEVNSVDLTALEVFRVFEPRLYARLSMSEVLMTATSMPDGTQREAVQTSITNLLLEVDESRRHRAQEVLKVLFPNREWAFGGSQYGADFYEGWLKDLQVCCKETFPRYFQLQLKSSDISQGELATLFEAMEEPVLFEELLTAHADSGRLIGVLDMLEPRLDEVALANIPVVIAAICNIGEKMPEPDPGSFVPSYSWTLSRIVRRLLLREPEKGERADALRGAIIADAGMGEAIAIIASEERRQAKKDGHDELVSPEQLQDLIGACLERLRKAANDGVLPQRRDLAHLLYRWKGWGTADEVRAWVSSILEQDQGVIAFLKGFTHRSTSQGFGDSFVRVSWFMRIGELEEFADVATLERRVAQIEIGAGDVDAGRAVFSFQEALRRRKEGKPDREFGGNE